MRRTWNVDLEQFLLDVAGDVERFLRRTRSHVARVGGGGQCQRLQRSQGRRMQRVDLSGILTDDVESSVEQNQSADLSTWL